MQVTDKIKATKQFNPQIQEIHQQKGSDDCYCSINSRGQWQFI